MPRVTVLLSVYNGLPYLAQAIDSVLAQTFEDFELLVIDDASTDGSLTCIQRYQDPRIRVVRHPQNLGQVASLNEGLALARAPYVARLDQDDALLPDRLQRQVAELDRRPDVDIVGSWVCYINAEGRRLGVTGMRVHDHGAFLGILLTFSTPFAHPAVMYRRRAVLDAGGYDPMAAPAEDYTLWCRLARRRRSGRAIPKPLMWLRLHGQQQSQKRAVHQQAQARQAHEELVGVLCEAGDVPAVSTLLRMDDGAWKDGVESDASIRAAGEKLPGVLRRARDLWRLSPREEQGLRTRISWWLAHEACRGLLRDRRRSLLIYQIAVRQGPESWKAPVVVLYPFARCITPLMRPSVHRACLQLGRWWSQQRYAARLWWTELRHRRASL